MSTFYYNMRKYKTARKRITAAALKRFVGARMTDHIYQQNNPALSNVEDRTYYGDAQVIELGRKPHLFNEVNGTYVPPFKYQP